MTQPLGPIQNTSAFSPYSSSSSSTAPPVQLSNFYSSFDVSSVLEQLTAAMQVPITQLTSRQQTLKQQSSAISTLVGQFSSLLNDVTSLTASTSVSTRNATVSGLGVTATAAPTSTIGSFTVGVTALATSSSVTGSAVSAAVDAVSTLNKSDFAIPVSAGTFTMQAASGQAVTITVDPTTQSLTDIVNAINAQTGTSGITATIQNDSNGRADLLQLDSTMGAIQLGVGSDTSNFLSATNLLASPGTTTHVSTLDIARIDPNEAMANASFFGGAPAAGSHTLTINGTAITYDAGVDSLNDLINRINSSAAGVTASYDSIADEVTIKQNKTGSVAMTLADDGQFLSVTGLGSATQTIGGNASYSINGGSAQYSSSNTVTQPDGTKLALTALTGGSPATVTIAQDTTTPAQLMNTFVTDYNNLLQSLQGLTSNDTTSPGIFAGDTGLLALEDSLRSIIGGTGNNVVSRYQTMSSIGLSFGAIGSAPGTANTLQLNSATFQAALQNDPVSVQNALSALTLSAAIDPSSTGSITGMAGNYKGSKTGTFVITDDGAGNLSSTFTPDDGTASVTQSVVVTANSTNSTLVLGMTLNIGALQAGTTTIHVTKSSESVLQQMQDFLNGQVGATGTLQNRIDEFTNISQDIDNQKAQIQSNIDAETKRLQASFTAMEQAEAQSSTILTSLTNLQNAWAAQASGKSG